MTTTPLSPSKFERDRAAIRVILGDHATVTGNQRQWCKCGQELHQRPGGWLDHIAEVMADLLTIPEEHRADFAHGRKPSVIPSRTTDPGTSKDAARNITMRAGTQRAYLLEAFGELQHFGDGATDEEAADYAVRVSMLSEYSKRCSELREALLIEPTGETRRGRSGQARIVSRITDAGRRWLTENT